MSDVHRMSKLELSPSVFSILSGLIEEKLGLQYTLLDRDILQEKASVRASEAGFDSLLDYYYFLRYDDQGPKELSELVEALVVNETYFFREWAAIEVMVSSVLEPLCAKGIRPRVWSAACSTGEEPLSLAMLLNERNLLDKVDIVASDISHRVLARPQKGIYGKRSVRSVPNPALVEKYLETNGEEYKISRRLVDKIEWRQMNLLDEEKFAQIGQFDIILCRNVLIYFSEPTIRKLLDRFMVTLKPDGVLLVGVSESLLRFGNNFVGEERSGTFIYRKASKS